MKKTKTGLEQVLEGGYSDLFSKPFGLLAHQASVASDLSWGPLGLKEKYPKTLKKLFGPQHGMVTDVQDNMIESDHFEHPFLKLPVYSLYSETRKPTSNMLEGIETLVVDLQDVGCRIYTYVYTLFYVMQACQEKGVEVVVLDRPNPLGGQRLEGNILEAKYQSFVGLFPWPVVHGMTMGEVAQWFKNYEGLNCKLTIIPLENWSRDQVYSQTGLPWVPPSPNLPTFESCLGFPSTVFFEGTNLSEGRGTTRSLELVGHPKLEPFSFVQKSQSLRDFFPITLRPLIFRPMFQKFQDQSCGGVQLHPQGDYNAWLLGQALMNELYKELIDDFEWKTPPYEYEEELLPIDIINGTDKIRKLIEEKLSFEEFKNQLLQLEQDGAEDYKQKRSQVLLYHDL